MSRRTSIVTAIVDKLKQINGEDPYTINLNESVYPYLKYWDEIYNFPSVYMTPGYEYREYHPAGFAWGFLNISIKIYTKGDDAQEKLENLLEDIERILDNTLGEIVYDSENDYRTTEISITSITTDEGLLAPYGVGEMNILVRYQIM